MANGFADLLDGALRGARLRPAALLTAALSAAVCGCQFVGPAWLRREPTQVAEATSEESDSAESKTGAAASLDQERDAALAANTWSAMFRVAEETPGRTTRWRHSAIEDLLARPADRRPNFAERLDDERTIVRVNGAIALARLDDARGIEVLADAVRSPSLEMSARLAAAEALGGLSDPAASGHIRELLIQYGDPQANGVYVAELHAELLHALVYTVEPAESEEFATALRANSPDVRLVALQAWSASNAGQLPPAVLDLRTDPTPRIRRAATRALVARRHPQALLFASEALHDVDLSVRLDAIAALGEIGGDEAQKQLREMLVGQTGPVRAAVVTSLALLDDWAAVYQAVEDEEWPVRAAAARALGRRPTRESALAVRSLLRDRSSDVRAACLDAASEWPIELAGPVLLAAMENPTFTARKDAAEQLLNRWDAGAQIGDRYAAFVHLDSERQQAMLAELSAAWNAEFGDADLSAIATDDAQPTAEQLTPLIEAEITRALDDIKKASTLAERRAAIDALRERSDMLPEALERIVVRDGQPIPDVVYHELLAHIDPQFDALDLLASRDLAQRRLGATKLARLAQETPLDELALHRTSELIVYEDDELVWRDVLMAVRASSSEPALRIAYSAMSHPAIEVRRRACGHLGDFPDPRHAIVLLPALEDSSTSVVRAAVQAMGHPGALDDPAPLEALLATTDKAVRLDAATALARLGSPAGPTALERLVYDGDPTIRRGAAVVMGQMGDERFTPSLMHLLDDHELGVRVVAVQALADVVGRDMAQRPDEPAPSLADQISRWKRWWDDEQQYGAAATLSEAPSTRESLRLK